MADLSISRVILCRPFLQVGIDFADPLAERHRKNTRFIKCHLSVFVCMAVNLFISKWSQTCQQNAFFGRLQQRFVVRRGIPSDIYIDCGQTSGVRPTTSPHDVKLG